MKKDSVLFILKVIIIIGLFIWGINLGVNAVENGQKKVDLYQKYLYSNNR